MKTLAVLGFIATACILSWCPVLAEPPRDPIQERIRQRLEVDGPLGTAGAVPQRIHTSESLRRFYEDRFYSPAWIETGGKVSTSGNELVAFIRTAKEEGLQPADYHLPAIEQLQTEKRSDHDPDATVDLDFLLTDAYLLMASHLLSGQVNPETIHAEWVAARREADLVLVLRAALSGGQIQSSLRELDPNHQGYKNLRSALARLRQKAASGGWSTIPEGPKLELAVNDPRVRALRARLRAEDYDLSGNSDEFDESVRQAVQRFQQLNGLDSDGVVGPKTLAALNVSVDRRIDQVLVNMERWRWLPQDLGSRYILVNVADFRVHVVEDADSLLTLRAVVGKPFRKTPVFSDRMSYLVLNPYWTVPQKIAVQDKLPLIQKDSGYLAKQNMKVFTGSGSSATEVNPSSVDWSKLSANRFPYWLRQDPGPQNALGRVKFMFPNKFSVYLHDTPSKDLFTRSERAFSSGCIRLQDPLRLAELLLAPTWSRRDIDDVLEGGKERTVTLAKPIPVHMLYWTAWASSEGTLHFRSDVYSRDDEVLAAIREPAPTR